MQMIFLYEVSKRPLLVFILLVFLGSSCGSESSSKSKKLTAARQAVEYLVFEIKEGRVQEFIDLDQEIWTQQLAKHPGFIAKEIWINEFKPTEVTAIIYWNSMEEWESISEEELNKIMNEFDEAFGKDDYELVAEKHQQNRWFKVMEYR